MIAGRTILCLVIITLWLATSHSLPNRRSRKEAESAEDDCLNEKHDSLLCGSNDVTYLNLCEFEKDLMKDPKLKIIEHNACVCDAEDHHEWDPVCASNGQSYANNCELMKARKIERLNVRHEGLCNSLLKRNVITYRELQKVKSWKSFMPHELYKILSNRDLADRDPGPKDQPPKHSGHKTNKKAKKLEHKPDAQASLLLALMKTIKQKSKKLLFTSNEPNSVSKLFG